MFQDGRHFCEEQQFDVVTDYTGPCFSLEGLYISSKAAQKNCCFFVVLLCIVFTYVPYVIPLQLFQ